MRIKWLNVQHDLYISKADIEKMEQGDSGIGYIQCPNDTEYELIPKQAFQPIKPSRDVIDKNSFEVCFISK